MEQLQCKDKTFCLVLGIPHTTWAERQLAVEDISVDFQVSQGTALRLLLCCMVHGYPQLIPVCYMVDIPWGLFRLSNCDCETLSLKFDIANATAQCEWTINSCLHPAILWTALDLQKHTRVYWRYPIPTKSNCDNTWTIKIIITLNLHPAANNQIGKYSCKFDTNIDADLHIILIKLY